MHVPLMELGERIQDYHTVSHVVNRGQYVGGPEVDKFEQQWADFVGAKACVGVNSGTDALALVLRLWSRMYPNRTYVVVPAISFVATIEAVMIAGLTPVVVDVLDTGLIDPAGVEDFLRNHEHETLAVVPVHLYGQVADLASLERLTGLPFDPPFILEDACQGHGAKGVGVRHVAAWSFMPAKILGGWGDGGAVTFPNESFLEIEERALRSLANHGRQGHNVHGQWGYNSRLDNLQAAVLSQKMKTLRDKIYTRHRIANWYNSSLGDVLRTQPSTLSRVWSYYACWAQDVEERDNLLGHLRARGIQAGCHYPYTLVDVFSNIPKGPGLVDTASRLAATTLTLPMWPGMSTDQQAYVIDTVREYFQ